jgi:hypothetical protein
MDHRAMPLNQCEIVKDRIRIRYTVTFAESVTGALRLNPIDEGPEAKLPE